MTKEHDDSGQDLIAWLEGIDGDDENSSVREDETTPVPAEVASSPASEPAHRLTIVEAPDDEPEEYSADDSDDESEDDEDVVEASPDVNSWEDLFAATTPVAAPIEKPKTPRRSKKSKVVSEPVAKPVKTRTARTAPSWLKPAAWATSAVLLTALVIGAVVMGRSMMGEYTEPVAAPETVQLDSHAGETPPTTTRDRTADNLPKDSVTVVSDGCDLAPGQERMPLSQKNLRAAFMSFQQEYAARNSEGVKALISPSNKAWHDQDWKKILDSLPADYSYCTTMPEAFGTTATATTRIHMNGSDAVTTQKITGRADTDGRWFIQKIESNKD
ncbi:hypothetical protein [Corynebacterium suicordis]|uniref:DUF8176 domain-containing protein n=1 Tax=Corynebacterium suicordis DSM 45110 TaxID=1121369 RepID=A0ABR9ZLR4_9CORY|nr:hypothetical protein [Corynebacterium suicordis]MBF4554373.1 hypothetical protein [Corynebacterium suicordis DSM 45110]MDR6278603.1 hypothetical protein [Corynebacterium suicordis]